MSTTSVRQRWARMPLRVRIAAWMVAAHVVVHATAIAVLLLYEREHVIATIREDLADAARMASRRADREIPGVLATSPGARWGPLRWSRSEPDDGRRVVGAAGTGPARIFVSAADDAVARTLRPLGLAVLVVLPLGAATTAAITWFVAGLAMRPIERVGRYVDEIGPDRLRPPEASEGDAPEVERLRARLAASLQRIETAYEAQARFVANVSHELRTPIAVMRTEAEVLRSGGDDPLAQRRFVDSVVEETDRMGRTIEAFLLLTRVRDGAAPVPQRALALNDVVAEAAVQASTMARQHGVGLEPVLDASDAPATVAGTEELLATAVGNLVRNAIRFSPRGAAVRIECARDESDGTITVTDRGRGIDPTIVDRIFDRFVQAPEEARRGRGAGLGLQIAQAIAELHGGAIAAENLEPGCRFTIRLPLADGGVPEAPSGA